MTSIYEENITEVKRLLQILKKAVDTFNEKEIFILKNGHSEQCLCGRLAYHLQQVILSTEDYSDYIVDVEYNRGMQGIDKEVKSIGTGPCRLDIAAHKRDYDSSKGGYDNLIAIEVKKQYQSEEKKQKDRNRLQILTNDKGRFHFKLGALIIANNERLEVSNLYSYYAGAKRSTDEGQENLISRKDRDTEIKDTWIEIIENGCIPNFV